MATLNKCSLTKRRIKNNTHWINSKFKYVFKQMKLFHSQMIISFKDYHTCTHLKWTLLDFYSSEQYAWSIKININDKFHFNWTRFMFKFLTLYMYMNKKNSLWSCFWFVFRLFTCFFFKNHENDVSISARLIFLLAKIIISQIST